MCPGIKDGIAHKGIIFSCRLCGKPKPIEELMAARRFSRPCLVVGTAGNCWNNRNQVAVAKKRATISKEY